MPRNRRSNRGGNQPPESPAAVSGPGRLSRRTDSATAPPMTDTRAQRHGQGHEVEMLQGVLGGGNSAPSSSAPPPVGGPGGDAAGPGAGGGGVPSSVPGNIQDPFATPHATGPLDRPSSAQTSNPDQAFAQSDRYIDMTTVGPSLPILEALASSPNATISLRNYVRTLRSQLPPDFDYTNLFTVTQQAIEAQEREDSLLEAADIPPINIPDVE